MSSVKIQGSATGTANFTIAVPDGTSTDRTIELPDSAGSFVLADASGNVAVNDTIRFDTGDTTVSTDDVFGDIEFYDNDGGSTGAGVTAKIQATAASTYGASQLIFSTSDSAGGARTALTEQARITAGGALLVGTNTPTGLGNGSTNSGISLNGNQDQAIIATSSDVSLYLNRQTSDGDILEFRRDGSSVGNIAASSGRLVVGSTFTGLFFNTTSPYDVRPYNMSTLSNLDNTADLGRATTARFNDAFIVNGVTTGSDANEKQQIAVLTDAEIAAAKRISAGFKTFKWNDAVEAKGDNARTHTGVIAQEVQAALEAEGLNAGNYAFWMSDTWWETQTEVPAVEADEENGIEAKEAYTRTDTYDTAEEAPAGAVERTRLGIRYPELLAFIGAATEQRLASIEARLDALEAV